MDPFAKKQTNIRTHLDTVKVIMPISILLVVDAKGRVLESGLPIPIEELNASRIVVEEQPNRYVASATDFVFETYVDSMLMDLSLAPTKAYLTGSPGFIKLMMHALSSVTVVMMKNAGDEIPPNTVKVHEFIYNRELAHATRYDDFTILTYVDTFEPHQENKYLKMLERIMILGKTREDRTGTGTISIFGDQVRFDISKHIPMLTTKFVPWRLVIEELLWFMRGDTDSKLLEAKNVNIWKGNTSRQFLDSRGLSHLPEGDIGAGYGFQWRHFGGKYVDCHTEYKNNDGVDQLANIIDQLANDPFSRRILMTAWNPCALDAMALPPCHNQVQFYVDMDNDGVKHLSCHMYQRSVDTFLGFPWNILSYSVMTYILSAKTGMKPKDLIISTGDTHIYKDHIRQAQIQVYERKPLPWAMLRINSDVRDKAIEDITIDDFTILGYFSHPTLAGSMSV